MTPDKRRRLHEAEGLADLCSRAGAVCGRGLLAEVEHLAAQLRDARAEIERLNLVVAAMDSQADENITEVLALTADRDHWRTEWEDADAKRITAEAELAAERAKVERVAVIRAEWGERKPDEPCHDLYVALGRALAGGER